MNVRESSSMMSTFFSICVCLLSKLLAALAHKKSLLTLTPASTDVVHYINDSYIVFCEANNTRVRWLDPQNNVIDVNRGRVHVEEQKGKLALMFLHIELADAGHWTCEALNENKGNLKTSFHMRVYKPISFLDTPLQQTARENKSALINCTVDGDPEPTVSWYFNGNQLSYEKGKYTKSSKGLLINKVTKADSGEYTCKAFQISTSISNVKELPIRLSIQHKPQLPPRRASANIMYGYVRGTVNITCEAEAEPPATFTWYRDDKELSPKHHFIHTQGHESILQVYVNDSNAFGDYVCKAENALGILDRVFTLLNGTKPSKPTVLQLRGVNSDTFDIDVGATRNPGPRDPMEVNGFRFEVITLDELKANGGKWDRARVENLGFEDGITYLITDLAPDTLYLVRVASRNPAGLSDWIGPKEFKTHHKAPLGHTPNAAIGNQLAFNLLGISLFLTIWYTIIRSSISFK